MSETLKTLDSGITLVDAPSLSTYKYSALSKGGDSFRLLRILPQLIDKPPIQCELVNTSISREDGKYVAGSYVWGSPNPKQPILLNGFLFLIGEKLLQFLRACRSRYKTQVMWIDAISINQDDIEERCDQVRAMNRIYAGAKSVYCWLGHQNVWPYIDLFKRNLLDELQTMATGKAKHILFQLRMLSQSDYWTRMWILQEWLLAADIHLLAGGKIMPYRELSRLLSMQNEQGVAFSTLLQESDMFTNLRNPKSSRMLEMIRYRHEPEKWEFEQLFKIFGAMPCSVPQDRVFALLGLVKQRDHNTKLVTIINYEISVWELLQRILDCKVLREPIAFVHYYAKNIIMETRDKHMKDFVSLSMEVCLQLPEHVETHCLDSSDDLPGIHVCFQALNASFNSEANNETGSCSTLYLYMWPDCPPRSYVLLALPAIRSPSKPTSSFFRPCALIEPCEADCGTACCGHAIVGFAQVCCNTGLPDQTNATGMMNEKPAQHQISTENRSLLHKNMQATSLPEALLTFQKLTRAIKTGPSQYSLETKLETLVHLSTIIDEIEEGFTLEITINGAV